MPIILSGQFSCHLLLKQKLLREEVVLEQKTVCEKYMKSGFIFITEGGILTSILAFVILIGLENVLSKQIKRRKQTTIA